MRSGLTFSVGLHAAILAVALVGVPWVKPKRLEVAEPIPVELVDSSQLPAAPKAAETPVRQPRPVREPPKPENQPAPQPPPPPTAAPAQPALEPPKTPQPPQLAMNMPAPREPKPVERPPEPVVLPKPPEPKPEPRPEPTPVSIPKPPPEIPKPPEPPPAAKPKPTRVPPPKVEPPRPEPAKPEPVKKEEPKPREPQPDFQSVLKNLAKVEPQARTEEPPAKQPARPSPPPQQSLAERQAEKLTSGEEDALRNQIAGCWNPPVGAREAHNLTAEIRVAINPDGTVRDAQVVDASRLNSDSFYRSFAESAVRAVRNPQCSPLRLSKERIAQHPVITFNFNPRDMF